MGALSPLAATNANFAFAARLLADLAAAGVRDVCLSPGSRSAPLAAAAATTPGLALWTHVDERCAGFFALGLARARRAPVALVCTSGTAAANFLPAVVEAGLARVPLVVLSADRPPEQRDWGAPQTIDQLHLFGRHVRWFAEAPPPDAARPQRALARALAARAVREASGPPSGPVHLNLPFREPLDPGSAPAVASAPDLRAPVRRWREARVPDAAQVERLAALWADARRPVLVAGPWDPARDRADAVSNATLAAQAPLLAEPLSQLRSGPPPQGMPLVTGADAMLRVAGFAARMAPDLVIRLGAAPTSKALQAWLERHDRAHVVAIDEAGVARDPSQRVDEWFEADPGALVPAATHALVGRRARSEPSWTATWLDADQRACAAIRRAAARTDALLPPAVLAAVADALPAHGVLALANSLAVRDTETFLHNSPRPLRLLANRGANGIDGTLSTALGLAASGARVALVTGDLAFLHDVGGLFAAGHHGLQADLVVVNDGGGAIFDLLPIAAHGEAVRFEQAFRLAHARSLAPLARAYGCEAHGIDDAATLRKTLRDPPRRVRVLEVRVDPAEGAALRRDVFAAVAHALGEEAQA